MKDQITNFVAEHPLVVIPILLLLMPLVLLRRYRRFRRRTSHINDPTSYAMLILGFVGAAIFIGIYLLLS